MKVILFGATGMVGGYAVRYALDRAAVGGVTTIGRKPTGITHPKLNEVLHQDFADCSRLADTLSRQDAAIFCLGAYTGAVSDADLRRVTVDYAVEFARVFRDRRTPGDARLSRAHVGAVAVWTWFATFASASLGPRQRRDAELAAGSTVAFVTIASGAIGSAAAG